MTPQAKSPESAPKWRRPPVTVGELIEALADCDAAMPVVVDGYESGYDSLTADSWIPPLGPTDACLSGAASPPVSPSVLSSAAAVGESPPPESVSPSALPSRSVLAARGSVLVRAPDAPRRAPTPHRHRRETSPTAALCQYQKGSSVCPPR